MAKKRSVTRTYLTIYGIPEMVERIEKSLGDPKPALERAYKAGMKEPEQILKAWFSNPNPAVHPHKVTGRTAGSYREGRLVWTKGGYGEYLYGFEKSKGGLPALYFEYGTPRIKPQFVMWYAVRDAKEDIEQKIYDEMVQILKENGLMA